MTRGGPGITTLREDLLKGMFLLNARDASVKSGGGNIEMGELVKTYGLLLRADEAEILYELVEKDVDEHTVQPTLANKGVQTVRIQCDCTMCRIFKKMKVQFKGAIP